MSFQKLGIACDHSAIELKNLLISSALLSDYTWVDYGTSQRGRAVDYPHFAEAVALAVQKEDTDGGLCLCGTGIGMSMVANRFAGVRAAVVWNLETAKLSRQHNDANVLCLGARMLKHSEMPLLVKGWLTTEFLGGRHQKRLEQFPLHLS